MTTESGFLGSQNQYKQTKCFQFKAGPRLWSEISINMPPKWPGNVLCSAELSMSTKERKYLSYPIHVYQPGGKENPRPAVTEEMD
jgi:hypothetical protein